MCLIVIARDVSVKFPLVIAANRTRHPLDARTLARLAARYADAGVVESLNDLITSGDELVGFVKRSLGLNSDSLREEDDPRFEVACR